VLDIHLYFHFRCYLSAIVIKNIVLCLSCWCDKRLEILKKWFGHKMSTKGKVFCCRRPTEDRQTTGHIPWALLLVQSASDIDQFLPALLTCLGARDTRWKVWVQDEHEGQEGVASVPACVARRRHQLWLSECGACRRGQGGLEHGEPCVWQWRSLAAEGRPWHPEMCLQMQFRCRRRQVGN